jgi:hypothetical protein
MIDLITLVSPPEPEPFSPYAEVSLVPEPVLPPPQDIDVVQIEDRLPEIIQKYGSLKNAIIAKAKELRLRKPEQYGKQIKYGWRNAIIAVAQAYRRVLNLPPRKPKSDRKERLIPKKTLERAYYNGYKTELTSLKKVYAPLTNHYVQPRKQKPNKSGTTISKTLYAP